MAIYSGFTHWKWWFSIAMLVYQRVDSHNKLTNEKLILKNVESILALNFLANPMQYIDVSEWASRLDSAQLRTHRIHIIWENFAELTTSPSNL